MTDSRLLWDVKAVAFGCDISTRQVWRLRDAGAMPAPLKLGDGRCLRWDAATIQEWIIAGCPNVRRTNWRPSGNGA